MFFEIKRMDYDKSFSKTYTLEIHDFIAIFINKIQLYENPNIRF